MRWWMMMLAGCVWDDKSYGVGSGCDVDEDCAEGLRCDGEACTAGCIDDSECSPPFACGSPSTSSTGDVGADGCYERCQTDSECQAGYRCDTTSGDCI